MRGLLKLIFSGRTCGGTAATGPPTWLNRWIPMSTDANRWSRCASNSPPPARSLPAAGLDPAERAAAILEFLQGPGGRTGSLPVDDLKQLHIDICLERDWEIIDWTSVGRELRRLLKADKTYDFKAPQTRVYRIPPLAARSRLSAV